MVFEWSHPFLYCRDVFCTEQLNDADDCAVSESTCSGSGLPDANEIVSGP